MVPLAVDGRSVQVAAKRERTGADIDSSIIRICRCGTYPRIRQAIHAVAGSAAKG
jgi:isoquinoline 1-oxidoreductase alpha subunit